MMTPEQAANRKEEALGEAVEKIHSEIDSAIVYDNGKCVFDREDLESMAAIDGYDRTHEGITIAMNLYIVKEYSDGGWDVTLEFDGPDDEWCICSITVEEKRNAHTP